MTRCLQLPLIIICHCTCSLFVIILEKCDSGGFWYDSPMLIIFIIVYQVVLFYQVSWVIIINFCEIVFNSSFSLPYWWLTDWDMNIVSMHSLCASVESVPYLHMVECHTLSHGDSSPWRYLKWDGHVIGSFTLLPHRQDWGSAEVSCDLSCYLVLMRIKFPWNDIGPTAGLFFFKSECDLFDHIQALDNVLRGQHLIPQIMLFELDLK